MEIFVSKEWYSLLDILENEKGIVLLLGATDTGKSTLAKYFISKLCYRGIKTALVDADIGQSFLGPPTTIGLSVFDLPPDWNTFLSPEIYFVGSTSPEGCFSLQLEGTKKMVDKALLSGAEVVLVDTTGFVAGETGKELKQKKIELLRPGFIIALQRSEEVEHILTLCKDNLLHKIFRLKPSEQVRPRTWEERKSYRMKKFHEYFEGSAIQEMAIDRVRLEGDLRVLSIRGLLLGLKGEDDDTLALGILDHYSEEDRLIKFLTSLRGTEHIRSIQMGSLRLTPSFEEERF